MKLYRLVFAEYAEDLSGAGAREYGGRWNPPGTPVLYTSECLALAILEIVANVPAEFLAEDPPFYHAVTVDVPDDVSITVADALPADWRAFPASAALAEIGYRWVKRGETLLLKVPSALTGEGSWNYLLNPLHRTAEALTVTRHAPFRFDVRLIRPGTGAPRR